MFHACVLLIWKCTKKREKVIRENNISIPKENGMSNYLTT